MFTVMPIQYVRGILKARVRIKKYYSEAGKKPLKYLIKRQYLQNNNKDNKIKTLGKG